MNQVTATQAFKAGFTIAEEAIKAGESLYCAAVRAADLAYAMPNTEDGDAHTAGFNFALSVNGIVELTEKTESAARMFAPEHFPATLVTPAVIAAAQEMFVNRLDYANVAGLPVGLFLLDCDDGVWIVSHAARGTYGFHEQVTTQSCNAAPTVSLEKSAVTKTGMVPATLNDLDRARIDALPLRTNKKVDLRKPVELTKRPYVAALADSRTPREIMESARIRIAAFRASPIPLRTEMSATDYLSRVAIQAAMGDCL